MPPLAGNAAGLAFVPSRQTAELDTTNGLLGATAPLAGNAAGLAFVPSLRTTGFKPTHALPGTTAPTGWSLRTRRASANPASLTPKGFPNRPPEPYIPQQPHLPSPRDGSVQRGLSAAASSAAFDQLWRSVG